MNIFGNSPINNFMYLTGKLSMYFVWIAGILQFNNYNLRLIYIPAQLVYISLSFASLGLLIAIMSLFNLGKSARFGLPVEKTILKTKGLYKFSRNPIYLGFYVMTIALMIYTFNPLIIILSIYGIYTHHKIVLSEENYLKNKFGNEYTKYCEKVRRYI